MPSIDVPKQSGPLDAYEKDPKWNMLVGVIKKLKMDGTARIDPDKSEITLPLEGPDAGKEIRLTIVNEKLSNPDAKPLEGIRGRLFEGDREITPSQFASLNDPVMVDVGIDRLKTLAEKNRS